MRVTLANAILVLAVLLSAAAGLPPAAEGIAREAVLLSPLRHIEPAQHRGWRRFVAGVRSFLLRSKMADRLRSQSRSDATTVPRHSRNFKIPDEDALVPHTPRTSSYVRLGPDEPPRTSAQERSVAALWVETSRKVKQAKQNKLSSLGTDRVSSPRTPVWKQAGPARTPRGMDLEVRLEVIRKSQTRRASDATDASAEAGNRVKFNAPSE